MCLCHISYRKPRVWKPSAIVIGDGDEEIR